MFAFLELEQVEKLHHRSLLAWGGSAGTRDPGMVESAIGAAINTALYGSGDVFEVAAAYAYHIAEAQAYIDGNKRTAIAACLAFLAMNHPMRLVAEADQDALYDAMIAIAKRSWTSRA